MTRRVLVRWALSLLAVAPFARVRLFAQVRSLDEADRATLGALARVALPGSLGDDGAGDVVQGFLRWVGGYRAGAEMSPGYGMPRLRRTPDLDISGYRSQLQVLREGMAREASAAATKARIRESLEEAGIVSLPARPDGRHVIADLLSYYLGSSEARDLCYQAAIRRHTCPGLAGLDERPAPLESD